MNHLLLLDVTKTLLQYLLRPMICIWLIDRLSRRSKPKNRHAKKRSR
jgi:phosphoserine phosphatase